MEIVKGGKEYFNKRYIKDHPYSLFICEDTLDELEFEDYSNVFPIVTYDDEGDYFRDKNLEQNKKTIKKCIHDILKSIKKRKYKKIILPEISIGKGKSQLYEKQPKTYEYIKRKIKELIEEVKEMDNKNNYRPRQSRHRDKDFNIHYPRSYKSRHLERYNTQRGRYNTDKGRYNTDKGRYNTNKGRYTQRGRYTQIGRYNTNKGRYNTQRGRYNTKRERNNTQRGRYNTQRGRYNTRSRDNLFRKKYVNNSSNSSNDIRNMRRRTKKYLKKFKLKKKEKKRIRIDSVEKASNFAQKKCNDCIKFKKLLEINLQETNNKKGKNFVAQLQKAEGKCMQCNKLCKYLDKNMNYKMEDYDIYEAKYPSICLVDDHGNKRIFRLLNSYRRKLLKQMENFDLNYKN